MRGSVLPSTARYTFLPSTLPFSQPLTIRVGAPFDPQSRVSRRGCSLEKLPCARDARDSFGRQRARLTLIDHILTAPLLSLFRRTCVFHRFMWIRVKRKRMLLAWCDQATPRDHEMTVSENGSTTEMVPINSVSRSSKVITSFEGWTRNLHLQRRS